jgi:hypothetical protein
VAVLIKEKETLHLAAKIRRGARNPGSGIRRGRVRRLGLRIVAAALALPISVASAGWVLAQTNSTSEYQVKAAFLFHFAQFVDWPPEAFKDASSPLTYCTAGEDPFHGALDASLNGKMVGARPVRVLHFRQVQETQGCQIVFLGTPEKKLLPGMLANLRAGPILTVGESEDFVQGGGMIGFFLEDNKVRFNINLDAAERAKLKISARLLALAKTVIGGRKGT